MKNYYQVLGVNRNSSAAEIKTAYKKLAKQWHPDINKSANAQEVFIEIHEAYEFLSDPAKRKLYDELFSIKNSISAIENKEQQNKFSDLVNESRLRAKNISKMKYDSFAETIFIGIGKAKYVFSGLMGLILIFVSFHILFNMDVKPTEIIFPLLFAFVFLKVAYDGLK